jgi:uracil-DNA glycosylase
MQNTKKLSGNQYVDESWDNILTKEFQSYYFIELKKFLAKESEVNTVYPAENLILSAFNLTPFHNLKVVILGQDPYHGPGQAHGLSFSVPYGVKPPPSLVNIFKEIKNDLGLPLPKSGNLEFWAKQGVLLLNAILTVRANSPASHHKKGWEIFTDAVIKKISSEKENVVFMLWGNYARGKKSLIDSNKHLVLEAAHPSPFSATNFFNCKHFSKANEYLKYHGKEEIKWTVPDL